MSSRRPVREWPAFQTALDAAHDDLLKAQIKTVGLLTAALPKAVETIIRMVDDPEVGPRDRMSAALDVLSRTSAGSMALACLVRPETGPYSPADLARLVLDPRNQAWARSVLEGEGN